MIPMIAALATKYGLDTSSMPAADMVSKAANAQQLRLVLGAVVVFEKLLKDAILVSEGDAWQTATATYASLRRAAKSRPMLAAELGRWRRGSATHTPRRPSFAEREPDSAEPGGSGRERRYVDGADERRRRKGERDQRFQCSGGLSS